MFVSTATQSQINSDVNMRFAEQASTGHDGITLTNCTFLQSTSGGDNSLRADISITEKTAAEIQAYFNWYLYITLGNETYETASAAVKYADISFTPNAYTPPAITTVKHTAEASTDGFGSGTVTFGTHVLSAGQTATVTPGQEVKVVITPSAGSYVSGYIIKKNGVQLVDTGKLTGNGVKDFTIPGENFTDKGIVEIIPSFTLVGRAPGADAGRPQGSLQWLQTDSDNKLTYAQALAFNFNATANNHILDSQYGRSWTYGVDPLDNPKLHSFTELDGKKLNEVGSSDEFRDLGPIANKDPKQNTFFGLGVDKTNVKPGNLVQTIAVDYYTASSVCGNHWYHVGGVEYHKDGMNRTITIAKDTLSITGLGTAYTYGSVNNATVTPATNGMPGSQATVDSTKLTRTFKDSNGKVVQDITKAVPGTYTVEFTYAGDDFIQAYTSGLSSTFTITKAANTETAVVPTATKTEKSITLGNLRDGQLYSIDGTNWYTKAQIEADNPFVGLDEGTEYTVSTKIAATATHLESKVNTATVTTDVTISGTISGEEVALPAVVTITGGGKTYTVTTDGNGRYTKVVPVGNYSISVAGKDGLQEGALASFTASKDSKSVPGITMADTAKGTAKKFVESKLKDKEGNIITEVTKDTLDQILASNDEFDKITDQNVKDAINEWMKGLTDPDKTYDELVEEAEKYLNDTTSEFIEAHMTDGEGSIITEAARETFDKILGGEKDFNNLTQAQKDEVNSKLKAAGAQNTYEELLAKAKEQIEKEANKFIGTYVSDEEGNIYPEATADNYGQILSGMSDWEALSQSEKDAINKKLAGAGSKPYEELLERAQEIKEKSDDFVKTYVSDKDGNVYKEVTKDNYEQIFAGKAVWDKLTQEEKDAIDAKLVAAGSKPYLELLKEAESLKKSTDGFIQKHLTGHDGQIFKTATRANYKQILGGLDDWNKLTQEQKDAINAKLKANGGKTYEELLKMAQDIQKQIEAEKKASATKTGDSAPIALYSLLAMFSLAGVALVERKKRYM